VFLSERSSSSRIFGVCKKPAAAQQQLGAAAKGGDSPEPSRQGVSTQIPGVLVGPFPFASAIKCHQKSTYNSAPAQASPKGKNHH
jgi:hypothetical protein